MVSIVVKMSNIMLSFWSIMDLEPGIEIFMCRRPDPLNYTQVFLFRSLLFAYHEINALIDPDYFLLPSNLRVQ